jgi:hypothetical protein
LYRRPFSFSLTTCSRTPNRYQTTVDADAAIWPANNPAYPGVPQEPPVVVRQSNRALVSYEIYVLAYSARQRSNMLLAGLGILLVVIAGAYLSGLWLVVAGILGGVGILVGLGSLWLTAEAHDQYRNELAVSVSETYASPPPTPQPETLRPFVAATENGSTTILVGRFSLPPATLAALFRTAAANDGQLTRDAAVRILPRPLYRDWNGTMGELQRLGWVDSDNRPTAEGWAAISNRPPSPDDESRAGAYSTHARRTHGARTAPTEPSEEWWGGGEGQWGQS